MCSMDSRWMLAASALLALTSCVAADDASPATDEPLLVGWYMQSAGGNSFQACGRSERWLIGRAADLRARAKAFGLEDDTPVYVKLQATTRALDKTIDVARVVQFGSPTPVRDCALDGVVRQTAPGTR